jgi:hypothetical protein
VRSRLVTLAIAASGAGLGWIAYGTQLPLILASCGNGPCEIPPGGIHDPGDPLTTALWMMGGAVVAVVLTAAIRRFVMAVLERH